MSSGTARVLVVEDDEPIRGLIVAALRRAGMEVDSAADGAEALRKTQAANYAVILLDLMLPVVSGQVFLHEFQRLQPRRDTVIIVMTAYDERVIDELDPSAVHALVRKPFDVMKLVEMTRLASDLYLEQTAGLDDVLPIRSTQPEH